jgi:hypothetical protein
LDSIFRAGRSPHWVKAKGPSAPCLQPVMDQFCWTMIQIKAAAQQPLKEFAL